MSSISRLWMSASASRCCCMAKSRSIFRFFWSSCLSQARRVAGALLWHFHFCECPFEHWKDNNSSQRIFEWSDSIWQRCGHLWTPQDRIASLQRRLVFHAQTNVWTGTYQSWLQPPSGQTRSKSSGLRSVALRSGWVWHLTGRPAYTWPLFASWMYLANFFQTSLPFRAFVKVIKFPIMIRPSRARESRTFNRSGADMKPISFSGLLRVIETITIDFSSPW